MLRRMQGTELEPAVRRSTRRSGDDRRLHVTVVAHEMVKHFAKIAEGLDAVHELLGRDLAVGDQIQRFADMFWRVMKTGLAGDLRVMEKISIQRDGRTGS